MQSNKKPKTRKKDTVKEMHFPAPLMVLSY